MLHLRVIAPPDRTEAVIDVLRSDSAAFNVVVHRGAAVQPAGDVVLADIAREGVNEIVHALRALDVHHDGSMALDHIDVSISDAAAAADRLAPGHPGDAAIWEDVDARVRDESTLTASFLAFLVVASLLAAVGLVEDAPILIVGAMVVGPEFGPIAGLSVGLFKRRGVRIARAAVTLGVGLGAGVIAALLATMAGRASGVVPSTFAAGDQVLTGFVVEPSILSFVVAALAGVAGTLSLTQARAGALIGVLISVTTIPAVAAIGVSVALGQWRDALGAATQLGVNVLALVGASVATLVIQREAWGRVVARVERRRA